MPAPPIRTATTNPTAQRHPDVDAGAADEPLLGDPEPARPPRPRSSPRAGDHRRRPRPGQHRRDRRRDPGRRRSRRSRRPPHRPEPTLRGPAAPRRRATAPAADASQSPRYDRGMPTATADALSDAARDSSTRPHRLLIGGERAEAADGRTFETDRPGHRRADLRGRPGRRRGRRPRRRRRARRRSTGRCARSRPSKRAGLIYTLAELIKANGDELAELESLDNGKPLAAAERRRRRLGRPPALLRGLADQDRGRDDPGLRPRPASSTRCASRSASAPRSSPGTSRC